MIQYLKISFREVFLSKKIKRYDKNTVRLNICVEVLNSHLIVIYCSVECSIIIQILD